MIRSKLFAVGFAFVTTSLLSLTASADYVCSVSARYQSNSGYGTAGYIVFTTYTEPACAGSFNSTRYVCTTGATSGSCPGASYQRTGSQLQAEVAPLRDAVAEGQRLTYLVAACQSPGSGNCLVSPIYYGD